MSTLYCRHIRTNGRRCCAFAVRGQSLCYFHGNLNSRHRALNRLTDGTENIIHPINPGAGGFQREPMLAEYYKHTRGPLELHFPELEDRDSIQLALSMLLKALGNNQLDTKRASTMFYGLQIASNNARQLTPAEYHVVRDTVRDHESGLELAPDEDPEEILEREQYLAALEQEDPEAEAAEVEEEEAALV